MKKALREENCSRRIAQRKRTNGKGRIKRRSCDQTGRRVRTESSGPGNRSGKKTVGIRRESTGSGNGRTKNRQAGNSAGATGGRAAGRNRRSGNRRTGEGGNGTSRRGACGKRRTRDPATGNRLPRNVSGTAGSPIAGSDTKPLPLAQSHFLKRKNQIVRPEQRIISAMAKRYP